MTRLKPLFSSYALLIIALFFYSFTQVDLNLTLSQASIYQTLEKQFQYIGFFQRPLSALIFSIIVFFLFIFYILFLYLAKKGKMEIRKITTLIFLTFIILVFSYNAFSYDLFNYIFDAKIITHYQQNPYLHKPLDFASDPMLNFMRWTHRLYPYGPSWLVLTVPLTFAGANFFLPTFFLFKLLMGLSFLGSCLLIYKISEILFPQNKIFNTVFWAFNPLIIVEGLVSAHNDIPMVFFALLSIFLYLNKKKLYSFLSLLFSVGIKYSTGVLLPILFLVSYLEKTKKKINWEKIFIFSVLFSVFTVVIASQRTTFQPWYLVFSFSLASFVSRKYYIFIPALILSFFAILIYVAYVYMTDYAKDYPLVIFNIELAGVLTAAVITFLYFLKTKLLSKH